ncbi:E3 ubiquitin-protein ligase RNF128a [Trichomycterus rosablanca]|uniref:E3 ubiquitin-protein ligase RNF128a n=1 Tax=Trichomycterus rosablanca TaxID=2290929 RepID=UPI002F356977
MGVFGAVVVPGRLLLLLFTVQVSVTGLARAVTFSTAYLNISQTQPDSNLTEWSREEIGLYGIDSPTRSVTGALHLADPIHACANDTRFELAHGSAQWVALIQRGHGCTFTQKINAAARSGASAAVIINEPGTNNRVIQMSHPGTTIVAVMIGEIRGMELLKLLENGVTISVTIEMGLQHGLWMSHYSVLFISISFFIITTATIGYFIFYLVQRFTSVRLQSRKQKQMKATVMKAINQLQVRKLHGDQETGPNADSCAVCIESYKSGDVVCILTCNHFFHKLCVEPWLMEHQTCPMCKCDILKALGLQVDEEEQYVSSDSPDLRSSFPTGGDAETSNTNTDTHSDATTPGFESLYTSEHSTTVPHAHCGLKAVCVDVQPHYDNPTFENESCT